MLMRIRRFNQRGLDKIREVYASIRQTGVMPDQGQRTTILIDGNLTEELRPAASIDPDRRFALSFELGHHLSDAVGAAGLMFRKEEWEWLRFLYLDQICQRNKKGSSWNPPQDEHIAGRRGRHKIRTAYELYEGAKDMDEADKSILSKIPLQQGTSDVWDVIFAVKFPMLQYHEVLWAMTMVYVNEDGALRKGLSSRSPWASRYFPRSLAHNAAYGFDFSFLDRYAVLAMLPKKNFGTLLSKLPRKDRDRVEEARNRLKRVR
jgi:hypothetical protein